MSTRAIIAIVIVNVILLIELVYGFYKASQDPENMSIIFLQYFLFMVIPTFIIGRIVIKRLRSKGTHFQSHGIFTQVETVEQAPVTEPSAEAWQEKPASYTMEKLTITREGKGQLTAVSKRRSLAGKVAAIIFLLFVIVVLESCIARIRQPLNVLHVLPGMSVSINGPLDKKIKSVQELTYISSTNLIWVSINEIYSGFWFGGTEWSGTLTVSPDIQTGEYRLTVFPKVQENQKQPLFFQIFVHPDQLSIRKSSPSLILRYTGIPAWVGIASFAFLTALSFLTVYYLSRKIEQIMVREGIAEIYRIRLGLTGYEVTFGLGSKQGVKAGDRLVLFDEKEKPVGTVVVDQVSDTDSLATASITSGVRVGYVVSIKR